MRVINPKFTSPAAQFAADKAAGIEVYLTANAGDETITFDKIRADFPALAAQLTDGMLAEIFQTLGYAVRDD